jgi:hypothetical protein
MASAAVCPTDVTFDVARPGSGSVTTTVGGLTPSTSYVCVYTHMMDDLMMDDLMMDDLMMDDLMVDGQMTLKKKEEGPKSDRTRMILMTLMILAHLISSP